MIPNFKSFIVVAQAYKHVFTSPSSVEKEPKATRAGNARLHGMSRVTLPSIAYIATQVRAFLPFLREAANILVMFFHRCDLP